MNKQSTEDLYGSETALYTIMVDTYHYKFVQDHISYNTKSETLLCEIFGDI